ncbi:MAG: response regulator [Burkholderiales bacterium]
MDIVIIDDEPVSLAVLKQLVGKLPDCDAQGFTLAPAALAWCKANDPDLVIVDYEMPNWNGVEFTQRLRALPGRGETPVLMVTVRADREVRNSAIQSGITDFLYKPFDFSELQNLASTMLGLRATKQLADGAILHGEDESSASVDPAQHDQADRLLNVNMTRARLGGDKKLVSQVASIFIRTVPHVLTSIRAALSNKDFERVLGHVTSLKGAVASLEAPEVFKFLADVETHARARDVAATAAAFAVANALIGRLLAELAPLAPQGTAS